MLKRSKGKRKSTDEDNDNNNDNPHDEGDDDAVQEGNGKQLRGYSETRRCVAICTVSVDLF